MNQTLWTGPHAIDDTERLAVVRSYAVLDTPPAERLDRLTRLVARTLGVPVAIVTIADEGRLWFASAYGTDETQTTFSDIPRGAAFSAEVISHDAPLVVEDAAADPRFCRHPMVTSGHLRFYAGVPLRSPLGQTFGTLCAIDPCPRVLTADHLATLEDLADAVVDELELTRRTAELERAQARTQEVLDATRMGFFAVDRAWRVTHSNEVAERLLRVGPNTLIGQNLWAAFPEAVGTTQSYEAYHRALRDGVAVQFEEYFETLKTWYDVRAAPFAGGLSVYFDDVTERHRIEEERTRHIEEIAERERAFRTLTEALPDVIARYDRDLRLVYVNEQIEDATGMSRETLIGKRSRDLPVPRAVARIHEQELRRVLTSGEPLRRSFSYDTPSGRRHYDSILVPERGRDGQIASVISATRDVTAEREAEAATAVTQDRYRALSRLVSAYAFAFRVDARGDLRPEWFTDTVVDVLGYTSEEMLRIEPGSLSHPDDRIWQMRGEFLLQGGERDHSLRLRHKNGTYRWIHIHVYPTLDARGRVTGFYGAAQDVTEQTEAKAELLAAKEQAEDASRLKDAFLANMSHEIRTPLTAILGFSELLREEAPAHLLEFIEPIELGGRRLMETLTSVLDLSQLRAGTITLTPRRCDVAEIARETVAMLQRKARQKGIALMLAAPATLPARLDTGAFARVLSNLVENAIKFTDAGSVEVTVDRTGEALRVAVRDTGCGMAAAFLPHVFDEFGQESSGLARTSEGSGLGLAITKGLVDLMGGTVRIESMPGEGTTVEVVLPVDLLDSIAEAIPFPPFPEPAPESASRHARVLVVEDSEPTQALLRILLGRRVDLVLATSADEALALTAARPWDFDLVLLDIHLGGTVSGLDLLPHLRRRSAGYATEFVALTADALPGDADRLLEAGFDGYLGKPFTQSALRALLTRTLGERPADTRPTG